MVRDRKVYRRKEVPVFWTDAWNAVTTTLTLRPYTGATRYFTKEGVLRKKRSSTTPAYGTVFVPAL